MNLDELTDDEKNRVSSFLLAIRKMCEIYWDYDLLVKTETAARKNRREMLKNETDILCSYLEEEDFKCPQGVRKYFLRIKEEIAILEKSLEADEIRRAEENLHEDVHKLHDDIKLIANQLGFELYPSPIRVTEPEQPELWWKQLLGRIGVRL